MVKFAEQKPDYVRVIEIPVRENKQDLEGPHQKFEVAITHD